MSGKAMARLALLVLVALVGAGLTLGAMNDPQVAELSAQHVAALPSR
jgi:hypothetical protein